MRITRLFDKVYTPGHVALTRRGWWLAALWACGEDAVLSHLTAAAFNGWGREDGRDVHVSTTRNVASRPGDGERPGIVVHRVGSLAPADFYRPRPFVVTHTPRTIVDCADVCAYATLRGLVDALSSFNPTAIRAAQERAPGRAGRGVVTRLLEADEAHTKSEFERRYLRFVRARDLPRPSGVNAQVAGLKADCVYAAQRLVVELDGRAHHQRRAQMRTDRMRDERYQLAGFRIVRLVWDDLHPDEAQRTVRRLRRMLASARSVPAATA